MNIREAIQRLHDCGLVCEESPYYPDNIGGGTSSYYTSLSEAIDIKLDGLENQPIKAYEKPFLIRPSKENFVCTVDLGEVQFPTSFVHSNLETCIDFICNLYTDNLSISEEDKAKAADVLGKISLEITYSSSSFIKGLISGKDKHKDDGFSIVNHGLWFIVFITDEAGLRKWGLGVAAAWFQSFGDALNFISDFYQSKAL